MLYSSVMLMLLLNSRSFIRVHFCLQYNTYIGNMLQGISRVRMNIQTCRYSTVVFQRFVCYYIDLFSGIVSSFLCQYHQSGLNRATFNTKLYADHTYTHTHTHTSMTVRPVHNSSKLYTVFKQITPTRCINFSDLLLLV